MNDIITDILIAVVVVVVLNKFYYNKHVHYVTTVEANTGPATNSW